jgi:hypothetical protein
MDGPTLKNHREYHGARPPIEECDEPECRRAVAEDIKRRAAAAAEGGWAGPWPDDEQEDTGAEA